MRAGIVVEDLREYVDTLLYAQVLVQLGDLHEAEVEVCEILDARPDDLDAFSLLAKLKHMGGRLSETIGCWTKLLAHGPYLETARMHLLSMLHLAQDPERGASEFLAMGESQLVRKPAAYLALGDAFRLFVAHRPVEGQARCSQVAARYRDKDSYVYKLAVMAKAFMAEMSGDLKGASRTLEDLGQQRGFETDTDRVLALLTLYERLGTEKELEAATNICRFLERSPRTSRIAGRLAKLYRRLGRDELARDQAARHLEAFRRDQHRPTFEDVLHVASRRYLPLDDLRQLRFPSMTATPTAPREAAIACALRGEFAEAAALLAEQSGVLPLEYRGDVAALEGRRREATRLYLEAAPRDPENVRLIGRLLDLHLETPSEQIAALLQNPEFQTRIHNVLAQQARAHTASPRAWRRLAAFSALHAEWEQSQQRYERRALGLERSAPTSPPGRVLAGAVYHFLGHAKGLVHEVWAGRESRQPGRGGTLARESILGNLAPDMKDHVRNTFLAVREYARAKFPLRTEDILDYDYTYKVTKEDEPSGGTSAGLPTALAFLSVFLQKPVAQDVAWTGPVITDSHHVLVVQRAGEVDVKVEGAYNRELRLIVVPAGNRRDLEESSLLPAEIREEIVAYAADLDGAVRIAFGETPL